MILEIWIILGGMHEKLPLEGIRVLDFCQMWAGPHATEWLSVMGAEIIKVETKSRIDYMRTVGAPPGLAGTGPNVGSTFATLNWGKKSITLNMNQPKAQELAKKLIQICDVVAENFGGGVLERWGLSYEEMKKIKPDIIYYAGSGYGRSGPHKERPAYAEIVDAFDRGHFCQRISRWRTGGGRGFSLDGWRSSYSWVLFNFNGYISSHADRGRPVHRCGDD